MTNPRKPPQGTRAASRSAVRSCLGESIATRQGLRSRVGPRARAFASARASRAAALHFLVVSDWGGLPVWPWVTPAQIGVADAMGRIASRHNSKFALSLGDHFYFSGVRDEKDPRFRRTFERAFRAPSLLAPGFFRVVAGNHDHDGNISAQLAYASRRNSRWYYPALQYAWRESVPSGDGAVVAFVLIDTVLLCGMPRQPPPADAETHWRWLAARTRGAPQNAWSVHDRSTSLK
uniref:Calcineurin-like phosphoesterase domain-containing protein n=2 Tax=Chrysotila carterae TaxID=13221 RepID=A0A7S4B5I7_CHRCT